MGAHRHLWKFSGIVTSGVRLGMSHSYCKCGGEMYLPATRAELRKHDPAGEVLRKMKKFGYRIPPESGRPRRAR
jgi:hypothetical protein